MSASIAATLSVVEPAKSADLDADDRRTVVDVDAAPLLDSLEPDEVFDLIVSGWFTDRALLPALRRWIVDLAAGDPGGAVSEVLAVANRPGRRAQMVFLDVEPEAAARWALAHHYPQVVAAVIVRDGRWRSDSDEVNAGPRWTQIPPARVEAALRTSTPFLASPDGVYLAERIAADASTLLASVATWVDGFQETRDQAADLALYVYTNSGITVMNGARAQGYADAGLAPAEAAHLEGGPARPTDAALAALAALITA